LISKLATIVTNNYWSLKIGYYLEVFL